MNALPRFPTTRSLPISFRGPVNDRSRAPQVRVNHRIRVPEVRVIADDGAQLGIMSVSEALRMAQDKGLDLVEVNPKAEPPVCKVMDYGKYKYEEKKKANEARKKQVTVETKEIKVRPKTDEHDLDTKVKHIKRFLEEGNKAKITVRFRGREVTHPEKGREVVDDILKALEGLIVVEQHPQMEGKTMTVLLAPKPAVAIANAAKKAAPTVGPTATPAASPAAAPAAQAAVPSAAPSGSSAPTT